MNGIHHVVVLDKTNDKAKISDLLVMLERKPQAPFYIVTFLSQETLNMLVLILTTSA